MSADSTTLDVLQRLYKALNDNDDYARLDLKLAAAIFSQDAVVTIAVKAALVPYAISTYPRDWVRRALEAHGLPVDPY